MEESEAIVFLKKKKNRRALKHLAFKAKDSRGWRDPDDDDSWMDGLIGPFALDQQKIGPSKAWRRLGNKTQVFSLQHNLYIRNRMSHTQEVAANAALIASVLGLNVDLCAAIAIAHDVGHLPFGHMGEFYKKDHRSAFSPRCLRRDCAAGD